MVKSAYKLHALRVVTAGVSKSLPSISAVMRSRFFIRDLLYSHDIGIYILRQFSVKSGFHLSAGDFALRVLRAYEATSSYVPFSGGK